MRDSPAILRLPLQVPEENTSSHAEAQTRIEARATLVPSVMYAEAEAERRSEAGHQLAEGRKERRKEEARDKLASTAPPPRRPSSCACARAPRRSD